MASAALRYSQQSQQTWMEQRTVMSIHPPIEKGRRQRDFYQSSLFQSQENNRIKRLPAMHHVPSMRRDEESRPLDITPRREYLTPVMKLSAAATAFLNDEIAETRISTNSEADSQVELSQSKTPIPPISATLLDESNHRPQWQRSDSIKFKVLEQLRQQATEDVQSLQDEIEEIQGDSFATPTSTIDILDEQKSAKVAESRPPSRKSLNISKPDISSSLNSSSQEKVMEQPVAFTIPVEPIKQRACTAQPVRLQRIKRPVTSAASTTAINNKPVEPIIQVEKTAIIASPARRPMTMESNKSLPVMSSLDPLIYAYLLDHGYLGAAQALLRQVPSLQPDEDYEKRAKQFMQFMEQAQFESAIQLVRDLIIDIVMDAKFQVKSLTAQTKIRSALDDLLYVLQKYAVLSHLLDAKEVSWEMLKGMKKWIQTLRGNDESGTPAARRFQWYVDDVETLNQQLYQANASPWSWSMAAPGFWRPVFMLFSAKCAKKCSDEKLPVVPLYAHAICSYLLPTKPLLTLETLLSQLRGILIEKEQSNRPVWWWRSFPLWTEIMQQTVNSLSEESCIENNMNVTMMPQDNAIVLDSLPSAGPLMETKLARVGPTSSAIIALDFLKLPDSSFIATISQDRRLTLYQFESKTNQMQVLFTLTMASSRRLTHVLLLPLTLDRKWPQLVVLDTYRHMHLIDPLTGQQETWLRTHSHAIQSLQKLPNGSLMTCSSDHSLKHWKAGHWMHPINRLVATVPWTSFSVVADLSVFIAAPSGSATLRVFSLSHWHAVATWRLPMLEGVPRIHVACQPNSQKFGVVAGEGETTLFIVQWPLENNTNINHGMSSDALPAVQLVRSLTTRHFVLSREPHLQWSSCGHYVAACSTESDICIWRVSSGQLVQRLPGVQCVWGVILDAERRHFQLYAT